MKTQITVKEVDEETFREFKAVAIRNKITVGTALTLAMEKFKSSELAKKAKFTDLEPVDWGAGTEKVSEQADEILYGE